MTSNLLLGNLYPSGLTISSKDFIQKYSHQELNKLLAKFKLSTITFNGTIVYHKTYIKVPERQLIIFPRMKGLKLISPLLDKFVNHILTNAESKLSEDQWQIDMQLLFNQEIVLDYLMDNIYTPKKCKDGTACSILNMKTGTGKTYLAMGLISQLKQKTLIVVPTSYLLSQWIGILKKTFIKLKIGCYHSKEKEDGDIMVIICNSVLSDKFVYKPAHATNRKSMKKSKHYEHTHVEFFRQFGLVIYDEIHKYCSSKMRNVFNNAQAKYMLGISATTDNRQDKLDEIAQHFLGPVIYAEKIKGYQKNITKFNVFIDMIKYKGPEKYTKTILSDKTGYVSAPLMINQICLDEHRKILLCNELKKLYNDKANTFIFGDRRDYLIELANMLYKAKPKKNDEGMIIKVEDTDFSVLLGGSAERDIQHAQQKSQMIFSTYAFLDTGVSITKMTTLVLATPRKNGWEQIIGRILRLGSDMTINRKIIILCDYNTAIKSQTIFACNKIKKLFNASVDIRTVNYEDVEISD